ncbi:hypothetical protein [Candidatus Halobonum tyrrellensis]|uniref:Uncharacterized protein n=1 Tax=Candidatus Halobonum tyrrellensis G22 TaxID=1324957 RepID=V4J2S3_9EURY|nr:hypothetical protein [Candidatus Halobonum tyrrellensis]ESP89697.1 hypothetical protein K933_01871 [Candidatus Halobonum tyrrellensis G22]
MGHDHGDDGGHGPTRRQALASWDWGRVVGWTNALRVVAGVASVAIGALLALETVGVASLL